MADALKLQVETRDPAKNKGTGTRVSRRLRKAGRVPGVIYGHKQDVVPISLASGDVDAMVHGASHLAELDLGGKTETVLIRDVQWDHLGKAILHVDFARVDVGELIETEVNLEYKGTAQGVGDGGVLEQIVHTLAIKCPAGSIPETIKVDVTNLKIDEGIHVRELELPSGVVAGADPDVLLVHVVLKPTGEEGEPGAESASQPEVIKPERKDKDKAE